MKHILYISYTGMLEPLGESQVLNYLVRLSKNHSITLLSFEKPEDLANREAVSRIQSICEEYSIEWIQKKYHRTPRLTATIMDLSSGVWTGVSICKKREIDLVHSRGHVPALMALIINKLVSIPFIFDMRAFWPEEMLNAGRINERSLIYRMVKTAETACVRRCGHLITLTHSATQYLTEKNNVDINNKNTVIPTCVNLHHFTTDGIKKNQEKHTLTLGIVGTISGWVDLEQMLRFFKVFKKIVPSAKLSIFSRDDPKLLESMAEEVNMPMESIIIKEVPFREVPLEMQKMDAGLFFYKSNVSELARSPTKMAEFLASGVPCIANPGVGDVEYIITTYNVGVVIEQSEADSYEKGVHQLLELLKDPNLSERCRYAAVDWYALDKGVEKYNKVYRELV